MGKNLEIYVQKSYTKMLTNFMAFLDVAVQDKKDKSKTRITSTRQDVKNGPFSTNTRSYQDFVNRSALDIA